MCCKSRQPYLSRDVWLARLIHMLDPVLCSAMRTLHYGVTTQSGVNLVNPSHLSRTDRLLGQTPPAHQRSTVILSKYVFSKAARLAPMMTIMTLVLLKCTFGIQNSSARVQLYQVNAVHCGASVSELYRVFVLHRQSPSSKVLILVNVYTGNEIIYLEAEQCTQDPKCV